MFVGLFVGACVLSTAAGVEDWPHDPLSPSRLVSFVAGAIVTSVGLAVAGEVVGVVLGLAGSPCVSLVTGSVAGCTDGAGVQELPHDPLSPSGLVSSGAGAVDSPARLSVGAGVRTAADRSAEGLFVGLAVGASVCCVAAGVQELLQDPVSPS